MLQSAYTRVQKRHVQIDKYAQQPLVWIDVIANLKPYKVYIYIFCSAVAWILRIPSFHGI